MGANNILSNKEKCSNLTGENLSIANQNLFGSGLTVYNNSNTLNSDKDSQKLQLNECNADTLGYSGPNQKMKDCVGCGVACNHTNTSPLGALCKSCFHHWRYKAVDYFFLQISI